MGQSYKAFGRRKTRQSLKTSFKLPWPTWMVIGGMVAAFFWFAAMGIHLPGIEQSDLILGFDRQLHAPLFLLHAGWVSLGIGGLLALVAWRGGSTRRRLLNRQRSIEDIRGMSWQQFELLVGEYFRRLGYAVTETGQGGADGGVDLVLRRRGEVILVQCKQWKNVAVGVSVIREMFGLMAHHQATGVKVVCCGHFTRDAREFAQNKPLDLIGGQQLLGMIKSVQ